MRSGTEVLHVISSTQRRGAEVLATELAPALDELGWRSSVIALAEAQERPKLPVPTLGSRRLGPRTLLRLRRRMAASAATVAHGSSSLPACALGGAGVGRPFVYRSVGDPRFWAPTRLKRHRTAILMRRAARVVALTSAAADALVEHYHLAPERVVVIPKGVSSARLPPRSESTTRGARERLGIPEGAPTALYLGALSDEKGVDLAVRALGRLPEMLLVVAGGGPERAALEDLAEETAAGRVRFVGVVADPLDVLTAADLLVLPSRTEGMPGAAMEASMVGLPVVATDVGWVSQVVVDGETGLLVPAGTVDALATAMEEAMNRGASLGAAGRVYALEHFDMRSVAEHWSTMLASVVTAP